MYIYTHITCTGNFRKVVMFQGGILRSGSRATEPFGQLAPQRVLGLHVKNISNVDKHVKC